MSRTSDESNVNTISEFVGRSQQLPHGSVESNNVSAMQGSSLGSYTALGQFVKMGLIGSRPDPPAPEPAARKPPPATHAHTRQPSTRSARSRPPMPERDVLESSFLKVLASMDLPPDKARLLRNYDLDKKWEIICDQDMVQAKDSPGHYLARLRTYLDPKASRSHRKRKMAGESTSTQVLRDLEISLRTNHIEWVREFLNENNQGLDVLIDYLGFRLSMMRHEQRVALARASSGDVVSPANATQSECGAAQHEGAAAAAAGRRRGGPGGAGGAEAEGEGGGGGASSPQTLRRRSRHAARLNMGASTDDIHVCILCMRAIMNNKYGFNMVIQHREAINSIALSLVHRSLRTKALVLELLAAICLVKGGHQIILSAFDNFKEVVGEPRRFHTLMEYFINYDNFHIEFMVACMQFVNIIVHSVEDMNFRVHLQYEFTSLRLDHYLDKLRLCESEDLQVQISAYLDNVFDVAALMEDSETKTAAIERANELEDELSHAHERMASVEREALVKLATLEGQLVQARAERDQLAEARRQVAEEVSTLRRAQQDSRHRQSMLESKVQELESLTKTLPRGASMGAISSHAGTFNGLPNGEHHSYPAPGGAPPPPSSAAAAAAAPPAACAAASAPPPPPAPAPPPPPPPPQQQQQHSAPPPPPPAPGLMQPPHHTDAMTIKRKVDTKYKLPTLNWIALKPNQVRGTIFNELDEERPRQLINFSEFEERFRIGSHQPPADCASSETDSLASFPSKRFRKPDTVSLLEHTRLRNIAISRRKLDTPVEKVIACVNSLDLKQLPLECVELLQRTVPTDQESKAYREYTADKRNPSLLTEEDKFLMQLAKVERLSQKLAIMSYMGNFYDNLHLVTPQLHAIISGSSSVRGSQKLRSVLEIILAFGNYMNSSKRGPAYGFKLQSLDSLMDTKSTDKRTSLLHYIASTVRDNFPDLLNFDTELLHIDKAAQVSLENVIADVAELERGMESVRREAEARDNMRTSAHVLREFLSNAEDKLRRLRQDCKNAQDSFASCVEYFGEAPRGCDANAFFSLLVRFTRAFRTADQDNEQRRRLEAAALQAADAPAVTLATRKLAQKKQQEAVINELKGKSGGVGVGEKKLLLQDEVYNGALEDILHGLRSEPYRRADAVRRSHRRRITSNRLSRGLEELDV